MIFVIDEELEKGDQVTPKRDYNKICKKANLAFKRYRTLLLRTLLGN